ncbi:MAG TPA: hypothetical protein VI775_00855, partial [Candidatus Paceibacterota bacterium]
TDSSGELPVNVYNIHKLFRNENELKNIYEENKGKYKILKETLIEDIDNFIKPIREKRESLVENRSKIAEILEKGGKSAKKVAEKKMEIVRKMVGVAIA